MKIKLKENITGYELSSEKLYEVIAIGISRKTDKTSCGTQYYLLRNNFSIGPYDENDFDIIDGSFDDDYAIVNDQKCNSLYILPKSIDTSFFHNWVLYTDEIDLTDAFYERFKHLIPEKKYAEFFKERYQDKKILLSAESIGNNWVICPECDEAFEVDENKGVLVCPNIACKMGLNNPYAKKFPEN